MTVRVAERRRSARRPAAYPTVLVDQGGRILARGRTANISEHGVFVVVSTPAPPTAGRHLVVEMTVPTTAGDGTTHIVAYPSRVVRRQELGHLVGLGIEFAQKIA